MYIDEIIKEKNISKYRLSKISNIPYATLNDIVSGKAQLEKCSAETIYKLSQALDVSMENLLFSYIEKPIDFELFKSNVCHELKRLSDIDFIIKTLEENNIRKYYEKRWYKESFYLLAMLDYVSRINGVPICENYSDIRMQSLSETIYPSSVIAQSAVSNNNAAKEKAFREAIPEFIRFNIVENEVFNVV